MDDKFRTYAWPTIYGFWIPILVAIVEGVIEKSMIYFGLNAAKKIIIDQKQSPDMMNKKAHKIIENIFEATIYFGSVVIELYLLR